MGYLALYKVADELLPLMLPAEERATLKDKTLVSSHVGELYRASFDFEIFKRDSEIRFELLMDKAVSKPNSVAGHLSNELMRYVHTGGSTLSRKIFLERRFPDEVTDIAEKYETELFMRKKKTVYSTKLGPYEFADFFTEFALPLALLARHVSLIEPVMGDGGNTDWSSRIYHRLLMLDSIYANFSKIRL